jgi:hypothetical protein
MKDDVTPAHAAEQVLPAAGKRPTRIICYAWGAHYVDILLSLTLPALLAPGNLPFVAAEVPCKLIILTERRFFAAVKTHPILTEIRRHCPIRIIRLDDLIVAKDKYGMTLTYTLHRGFSDLGAEMVNQWQIFLNADFILADGSLRNVLMHLSRGERIVAAPSYCVNSEEARPKLQKWLDSSNLTLCIPPRELARLILAHRHTVIRGKTVNQQEFHVRYMDQFYWDVDGSTLIGFQMPVAIVGLHPERQVAAPNSYWDYGLIWEYCPSSEVRVLGDSDEFLILELREKEVAQDQVVAGPPDLEEIAQRMVTWVTPYQSHFLRFPLTLHHRDLPSDIEKMRHHLQVFTDQVISLAPMLPSHIKHPQWEYHWHDFNKHRAPLQRSYRRISAVWFRVMALLRRAYWRISAAWFRVMALLRRAYWRISAAWFRVMALLRGAYWRISATWFRVMALLRGAYWRISTAWPRVNTVARGAAKRLLRPVVVPMINRVLAPVLRRGGLAIVKSADMAGLQGLLEQKSATLAVKETHLVQQEERISELSNALLARDKRVSELSADLEARNADLEARDADLEARDARVSELSADLEVRGARVSELSSDLEARKERVSELTNMMTEYQFKLERSYDYQSIMDQDGIRRGMSRLEPEFQEFYDSCRQYTMTSWERLYVLYKSVRYIVENGIPGDLVECGVWRGGSIKLAAQVLLSLGATDRLLFLYDTFEGMTEPDPSIDIDFAGNNASKDWIAIQRRGVKWSYAPVEEVHDIMVQTGYPMERVRLIKGPVEQTIPETMPDKIALLRLYTDWYASTKHEMQYLYPRLSPQGILILDDYGHYQGAARAVDEYLAMAAKKPLLHRVDYSCRSGIKPAS